MLPNGVTIFPPGYFFFYPQHFYLFKVDPKPNPYPYSTCFPLTHELNMKT